MKATLITIGFILVALSAAIIGSFLQEAIDFDMTWQGFRLLPWIIQFSVTVLPAAGALAGFVLVYSAGDFSR